MAAAARNPLIRGLAIALVMGAGLVPARAGRAERAATPKPWYEEVTVNGFLSTSYSFNFNRPDSRTNQLRVFDFDDNSFKVDVLELVVQHAIAKPREAGFRVDLVAGGSIPLVSAASGLFRDPASGVAEDFDLQQAFASYVAPVGSGLRVDVGKFVTHHGAEVIEGYDGWNENATRSFLFGFAIPFTHTGVRAVYNFGPKATGTAMVVNGWDNATDNNKSKSVGAQLALTPIPALVVYLNGMVGAERANNDSDLRSLIDAFATLKPSPRVSLGLNLDYGQEQGAAPALGPQPAGTAAWSGVAGYVRLTLSDRWAWIVRGEGFDDRDGARTRTAQTLKEVTLTPELRVSSRLVLRGDLRTDWSTERVFMRENRFVDHQTTVLVNALATF